MMPSTEQTQFMQELWEGTSPNPFDHRERVWCNAVGIECYPFNDMIHLSAIRTLVAGRQGYGSKALQALCEIADRLKVTIDCDPTPFGSKALSRSQLTAWYKRHGFQTVRGQGLVRRPS